MNPQPKSKGNILLVDDMPDNLQLLSDLLVKLGYTVRSVTSGRMALKTIQVKPPDLILLDVKMPEMNGYQVCEALKANPDTYKIPVIFISALDDVFDKVKAFECGGADYITKPFQMPEVVARLENQLTIQHQQRLLQEEIAKRRETEEMIYQSRSLLASVLNSSFDGIAALEAVRDPNTGEIEDFRCLVVNPVISKFFNQSREELFGKLVLKKFLDEVAPELFDQFVAIANTGTSLEGDLEYTFGDYRWYNFSAVKLGDGFAVTVRNITARKQIEIELREANKQLREVADLDALTQVTNRRNFSDRLRQEVTILARQDQPLSLILVDVDDLESHNDTYGYMVGDNVLIRIAQAIQQVVDHPNALVARYGGDEFAILLPRLSLEMAIDLGEAILQTAHKLAIPHSPSNPEIIVTISIGIVTQTPTFQTNPEVFVVQAYQAMQKAQEQGGNLCCHS